jgi:hypothetical protein
MKKTSASSATEYLDELPPERRAVLSAVRHMVLRHLADGYQELVAWGMIVYGIPLERYPNTYNGAPLCSAALAGSIASTPPARRCAAARAHASSTAWNLASASSPSACATSSAARPSTATCSACR